ADPARSDRRTGLGAHGHHRELEAPLRPDRAGRARARAGYRFRILCRVASARRGSAAMTPTSPSSFPTRWPRVRWRYVLGGLALLLVVGYLLTGIYVVNTDEHAVVRRFGAVTARAEPGMHYRLPWPVDEVDVVKTTNVMKIGVGFALPTNEAGELTGIELLT